MTSVLAQGFQAKVLGVGTAMAVQVQGFQGNAFVKALYALLGAKVSRLPDSEGCRCIARCKGFEGFGLQRLCMQGKLQGI